MTAEAHRLRIALEQMSEDRKALLMKWTGGREPTLADLAAVSAFIRALADTVEERRVTSLKGLGVFEWLPWKGRLPTGRLVSSWRLVFRYRQKHRYVQKKGRRRQ